MTSARVLQFPQRAMVQMYDTMRNVLAGFGVLGRDKAMSQRFILTLLNPEELTAAYRGDWLARKIVEIPAFDSCRAWRDWEGLDENQVEDLEGAERAFGLQRKLMEAMAKARLFGGAALIMGIEGQRFEDELDIDGVSKDSLKFVHVCSRWTLTAGQLDRDITSPWFGEPSYYERAPAYGVPPMGGVEVSKSLMPEVSKGTLYIHPSRVVRLIGLNYPDLETAPDQWGDSSLQPVFDALRDAGLVSSSMASMISEAKLDIIKVPNLTQLLSTDAGSAKVFERFSQANVAKSVVNATLLDKEEEWDRVQLAFSGMDRVQAAFDLRVSGAADVPSTRIFGRSPEGMNATGESDLRNYYDRLSSDQKIRLTPIMSRLDEVLLRHVFGTRPKEANYEWSPLWQLSETEKADVNLKTAQAHKIDVDSGLINPDALRQARINQCVELGFYPGLESAIDEFGEEPDEDDVETQLMQAQIQAIKNPPKQPGAKTNGGSGPRA